MCQEVQSRNTGVECRYGKPFIGPVQDAGTVVYIVVVAEQQQQL
jgi:hypothetical protein